MKHMPQLDIQDRSRDNLQVIRTSFFGRSTYGIRHGVSNRNQPHDVIGSSCNAFSVLPSTAVKIVPFDLKNDPIKSKSDYFFHIVQNFIW